MDHFLEYKEMLDKSYRKLNKTFKRSYGEKSTLQHMQSVTNCIPGICITYRIMTHLDLDGAGEYNNFASPSICFPSQSIQQ